MLKNQVVLEVVKNDKTYQMLLPLNAQWGELYDVLFDMRCFALKAMQDNLDKEAPKQEEPSQEEFVKIGE